MRCPAQENRISLDISQANRVFFIHYSVVTEWLKKTVDMVYIYTYWHPGSCACVNTRLSVCTQTHTHTLEGFYTQRIEFRLWEPETSSRKTKSQKPSAGEHWGSCPAALIPSLRMHERLKLLQLSKSHQLQWNTKIWDLSMAANPRIYKVLETSTPSHSPASLAHLPWLSSWRKHTLSNIIISCVNPAHHQQIHGPLSPTLFQLD